MDPDAIESTIGSLLGEVRPDSKAVAAHETKNRVLQRLGATPTKTALDRYTMQERLGHGGWGVVFAAYDDRLQRRVAIKLLHETFRRGSTTLLREARAMARISHRNVVAVHDVGEVDGQLFIVMDLVEGRSLAQWLEHNQPRWPAIVGMFVEAGRGLQCAHEAGLVHRDFKAGNVLVGDDGRVQVTDFGVAAPQSELAGSSTAAGTPGFQAPEVVAGRDVGPAADQYSFCAALRQALQRSRAARSPRWLDHAIHRGLSPDAGQRWPSMKALIDHLEQRQKARQTRTRGTAIALSSAAVVAGTWGLLSSAAPSECEREAKQTAARVDESAAAIEAAFESAAPGRGGAEWAGQEPKLQAIAQALSERQHAQCRAEAEVSTESSRRQGMCLDQRSWELQSVLEVFAVANITVVDHASVAVALLRDPADCEDPADELALPPPDRYVGTLQARRGLALAKKLEHAGQYDQALVQADAALASAIESEYPPLVAEASYRRAMQLLFVGRATEAREASLASLRAAHEGRHDRMVAWSQTLQASIEGYYLGDPAAGRAWAQTAEASVHRLEDDPTILGALEGIRSMIELHAGDFAAAIEHAQHALDLREAALPPTHPYVAGAHLAVGNAYYRSERYPQAAAAYRRALTLRQQTLGADHPQTGIAHNNVALPLMASDRNDEAREHLLRALQIAEQTAGDAIHAARVRYNLLRLDTRHGHLVAARRGLEALLREPSLSTETNAALRNSTLTALAGVLSARGEYALARTRLDQAERLLPEAHPDRRFIEYERGMIALDLDDFELATRHFQRAVTASRATFGEDSQSTFTARTMLARTQLEQGKLLAARAELQQLLPLAGTDDDARIDLALIERELGRSYVLAGEFDHGERLLKLALGHHGDDPWDHQARGETLLALVDLAVRRGSPTEADRVRLDEAERALGEAAPRHAPALARLRDALSRGPTTSAHNGM